MKTRAKASVKVNTVRLITKDIMIIFFIAFISGYAFTIVVRQAYVLVHTSQFIGVETLIHKLDEVGILQRSSNPFFII